MRNLWKLTPAFLTAFALACGGGEGGAEEEAAEATGEAGAAAVDPSTVGTIRGTVNFAGTPPAAAPIDMSEEPACAEAYGSDGPMTQEVVAQDGKLANVFVYVTNFEGSAPASGETPVLDQHNCRYTPHVLGVQTGRSFTIRNSDDLLHNINANPSQNRGFNISQPRAGIESTQSFRVQEVMIPVSCDVHGWMNAYIGVVDHPYFAVSGPDGSFTIANVPPGEYDVEAWHERYGTLTGTASVTAQGTAEVTFDYSADMAGRPVPLGEPLVVHHGPDGITTSRGSAGGGAGR